MRTRLLRHAALALAASITLPTASVAVPAFARQTGVSGSSCHFQHFPALTAFGQSFKAGNYASAGGQSMLEGDILSLPAVLNLSMVLKMKYVKTNGGSGEGSDRGEFMMPDEASIFVGGRVGNNMGFLIEGQLADQTAPVFASFKVPIGADALGGRLSVVPFATDGLGTPFGFELLSTGAVRNVRSFEERAATSAQQYVVGGAEEGVAEGLAFVYSRHKAFANVTMWTPNKGTVALDRPAFYMRAAVMPTLGSWTLGGGVQWWVGSSTTINRSTKAIALDAQAHGSAGGLPLGLYVTYSRAPGTPANAAARDTNFFNSLPRAQWAVAGTAELGIVPGRLTVGLGYREARNGAAPTFIEQVSPYLPLDPPPMLPTSTLTIFPPPIGSWVYRDTDRAFTLSSVLLLAQNFSLHVSHTLFGGNAWKSTIGDDQKFSMTLFAAF